MNRTTLIGLASLACVGSGGLGAWAAAIPEIAPWYENKEAAVSLRFDDALESHVRYVIPKLNEYGIKATFMITPGLPRYRKHKEFWENQVPNMGHQLGNHTMHHRGAESLEEAEYEIGEVSRLIWRLYPNRSKLAVFASGGGGKKWGGMDWEKTPPDYEYKKFVKKYHLIDLYDGKHPAHSANSRVSAKALCGTVDDAIRQRRHLPIVFHGIGDPGVMNFLKVLHRGHHLTVPLSMFQDLLLCLKEREANIWLAPLGDILKYEAERSASRLQVMHKDRKTLRLSLSVDTDPELYDQDLTLLIPVPKKATIKNIFQDQSRLNRYDQENELLFLNVRPVSSSLTIFFQ